MHRVLKYWFVLLAFAGCGKRHELGSELAREDPGAIASEPLSAAGGPASGPPLFTSRPAGATGIDFTHRLDLSHPLKRLYHGGFATGGIAIGDLDGDGLPDVYFVSGPARNQLYRNLGGLRFEIVTGSGLDGGDRWGTGAAMADIDNDGDLDLYVCNYQSPNQLFINGGDMQFSEQAEDYGLDYSDGSLMPSFCDYDNDGDLDCFVLTYRLYREGGWPQEARYEMRDGVPVIKEAYRDFYKIAQSGEVDGRPQWSVEYVGRRDRLFRNDGAGKFEDVSEASGITGRGHGLSATWWDADGDGWMDLYVGNDFNEPDRFYRNLGDGSFENVIREAVPHTSWFSMGADFADLDNDGRFDFLVADMSSRTHFDQKVNMGAMGNSRWFLENTQPPQYMRNALYLNSGTWRFNEAAYLSGLADTDWTWAVKLADFDNDGRVDAYFSNGAARNFTDSDKRVGTLRGRTQWDAFEDGPMRKERNLAFRNMGALSFENVSEDWGLDHEGVSYAAAVGDLDRDGDLDLVVGNLEEPVSIYRNNSSGRGICIQLCGTSANRFGFGAWVEVQTRSGIQVRQLAPASGFLSSNEPLLHFGTGGEPVDELTVRWPGGKMQRFRDLEAGRRYRITEGDHHLVPAASAAPLFAEIPDALGGHRHREQEFDDFAVQPLLPNRLSRLGPGVAASSSGEMLWLGGAKGQAGEIRRGAEVIFRAGADSGCEDMGAVFFDADGDGDEDLYVVSGGDIDIGGWLLSDSADNYAKFAIAPATILAAGGFLLLDESDFNVGPDAFALSGAEGDDVFLIETDSGGNLIGFVDSVEFGASAEGETFGRWPDASGRLYPMLVATPGAANAGAGNAVRTGPVVVSEIHYNPDGADENLEFIQIRNSGTAAQDLSNWRLRGEVDFDFTSGRSIAAGGTLLILGFDPADTALMDAFELAYPAAAGMDRAGPWGAGARLDDGGGTIKLQRPDSLFTPIGGGTPFYPMLVEDTVHYDDESGWPLAADGAGASLQRISDQAFGDDPANWTAQDPPLGPSTSLTYAAWQAIAFPPGTPAADRLEGADPEGDGLTNFGEYALALDPLFSDAQTALSMTLDPGNGELRLAYRRRTGDPSISIAVSQSVDLMSWQAASVEIMSATTPEPGVQELQLRFTELVPSEVFRRLMFRIEVGGR